jgi:chorismate mutase/prephenate dehydratase
MTHPLLDDLRKEIEKKDRALVKVLNERARLSIEIGKLKEKEGLPVYDPARESVIYRRLSEINEGPLLNNALNDIFREILSQSRSLQSPVSVAFLGPEASFTHLAAQSHFGTSTQFVSQHTIFDVFDQVERERVAWGVVPVENSLEGTVNLTLDRLSLTPLNIRAEIFLPIYHCLMSTGTDVDALKRIYSHPQALAQCQGWLRKNLPNCSIHATESTARAAQMALEDKKSASIGSKKAASLYGLTIISEFIGDHPSNVTRFLVIGRGTGKPTGRDKTSILFGTRHEPGALYRSLEPFARQKINLMKIESYPIKESVWEYLFFVDINGSIEDKKTKECLKELREKATFFKMLGSYPMGESPS